MDSVAKTDEQKKGKRKTKSGATATLRAVLISLLIIYIALFGTLIHGVIFDWLPDFWTNVKEAQASIITGGLTLLASLTASIVLPYLLGDQIRGVREVAAEAERYLKEDLRKTLDDATKVLKTVEQQAFHAEGILTHRDGSIEVSSPEHARELTNSLYQAAKRYCEDMIETKPYMHGQTKDELRSLTNMSQEYIGALKDNKVISKDAAETIELIRATYRAYSKVITASQVNEMDRKLLELIDGQNKTKAETA